MELLNNENEMMLQHRNQSQKAIHPFDSHYFAGDRIRVNMCTSMKRSADVRKGFKGNSHKRVSGANAKKKTNRPAFINHNQLKIAWQEGSIASLSNPKITTIGDKQSGSINFDTKIDL